MTVYPSSNIELQQSEIDRRGRKPGVADNVVDIHGRRSKRIGDQ
jgi:hypothetical protein